MRHWWRCQPEKPGSSHVKTWLPATTLGAQRQWFPVVDNLRTLFLDPPVEMRLLFQQMQELAV